MTGPQGVTEGPDVAAAGTVARVPGVSCPQVSGGSGIDGGAECGAGQRDMATRMGQLIAALPDRDREVLVVRLVRRFSVEDTAKTLGSTPTGVLIAQHHALDRLRSSIADTGGGPRA